MSFQFKLRETVPDAVKRIAVEEIENAAYQLHGKGEKDRDEAIHEARKSIKKIRGVLRLMAPELGRIYKQENSRFRDIGRKISEFRDAGAMLETFDDLKKRYAAAWDKKSFAPIRDGLVQKKARAEKDAGIEKVLAGISLDLSHVSNYVKKWPLHADGFAALEPGLRETFSAGRKALAEAKKHPLPENFHDWRKRVKAHWYHIRLMEPLWTDVIKDYERSLKQLETWLGSDHNLVVLGEKIMAEPAFYGSGGEVRLFLERVEEYQKELRGNAISLGEQLYEEKPRHFTRRMQHLWEAWEALPQALVGSTRA